MRKWTVVENWFQLKYIYSPNVMWLEFIWWLKIHFYSTKLYAWGKSNDRSSMTSNGYIWISKEFYVDEVVNILTRNHDLYIHIYWFRIKPVLKNLFFVIFHGKYQITHRKFLSTATMTYTETRFISQYIIANEEMKTCSKIIYWI